MAKSKGNQKASTSVPNKHLFSRLSYLHQAATSLGVQVEKSGKDTDTDTDTDTTRLNLARHLLTTFRATSLKSQIRVSPAIKHTICKFCDSLLIEGKTSTSVVENRSKGGRKPWADVLVVRCDTCGGVRRFPVGAERQKRRPLREQTVADEHRLLPIDKGTDAGMKG
ncbi:Rpr2-domain-containing protein [Poronia punctata]|nr:Rpr2-domain-containing protein [Poronia punctata]